MYLKTTKQKNKDGSERLYLQLVEGYREGKTVKQKVLCNIGRIDKMIEKGQIDRMIEMLVEFSQTYNLNKFQPELFNENVIYQGPMIIFRKLWKELGLKEIMSDILPEKENKFNSIKAIEQMVLSRLVEPTSKRALGFESNKFSMPDEEVFSVHQFYRAMDELYPYIEEIENKLFEQRPYDLFNQKLDVVFFDTTSVKFYGENPDVLMKHGHSKEKRRDLCQMVVGLLVDCMGIPIGHKIFTGNSVDVKVLKPVVEEFKQRFRINKVILIADKGLMSEDNLNLLKEIGWQYIICGKLKNEKYIKETILKSTVPYTFIEENLLIKEIYNEENSMRYILCYNPIEGWEKYESRKSMIDKLNEYEGKDTKVLVNNKGYKSYIKSGISKIMVDRAKIQEEVRYDGRYILKTNCELPSEEVVYYYKSIIKVEQCFHQLKGVELIAPVYHWTERRVRTHVFICFLALLIWQIFVEKIKAYDGRLHERDIWRSITNMLATVIQLDNKRYLVRQEPSQEAIQGFKACNAAIPARQKLLV